MTASGCSWVLKGFSKFMLAGKDVCGWSNISAFVQELKKSRYWMFTESPHHLFMITHSTLRDILTFLIFVFDISKSQIHTHPPGLLPKSRSDTHPRTLSVKSIRLCICAIGIKITPRSWSPNAIARNSAWQSHDNSGSLGCWMLIELNKQISVTWIGHHFQGVQIWVLRRLACYGVGLQGRGNESPVQVAPRELRDGFSSAPGSPLHSHF